jgi:hypothetical protein
VRESCSFWEDAANSIGNGDVEKGRAAVDPDVALMEKWLTKAFNDRDERSSGWLFLFAIACMIALFGALNSAPFITAVMVGVLCVATVGYTSEKLFYRRLVKKVRRGKSAPQVFTDGYVGPARNYIPSMFSTSRTMFGNEGEPVRFAHEPSALDLVWLSSIKEALPLKQALCGSDQFPVAISYPEREVVPPPQPESQPQPKITYYVTKNAYFDQRQLHVHASAATADSRAPTAARATKSKAAANIAPHWLHPIDQTTFEGRYVSFDEYLPGALKWMSLVVRHAYPVVQKHKGWSDAKLLDKILQDISTLLATSDNSKSLPALPNGDTIKKLFNRGRADPAYRWVREYFTDHSRRHKYQDIDQDRLPLSNSS